MNHDMIIKVALFFKVFIAVTVAAHKNLSFAASFIVQNLYQYVMFIYTDRI